MQSSDSGLRASASGKVMAPVYAFAPGAAVPGPKPASVDPNAASDPNAVADPNALLNPAVAEQQRLYEEQLAEYEEQKKAEEEQWKKEQNQQRMQSLMSALGGGFSGGYPGAGGTGPGTGGTGAVSLGSGPGLGSGYVSNKPPGSCNRPVNNKPIQAFKSCLSLKNSALRNRRALVLNTDERIGYQLDPNGSIVNCFTITIGSRGVSRGGNPRMDKQTEVGFFSAQQHDGAKYNSRAASYDRKGIGMGIDGGKVLHSDHGRGARGATHGCIGIEKAKWKNVFDTTRPGDSIFVWSERINSCNGSIGADGAPPNVRSGVQEATN